VHIYIPCSKVLQYNFFLKCLSYLYEVVRTNSSADFWTFHNFWPQFQENCGANGNGNYPVLLKLCPPLTNSVQPWSETDRKKHSDKHRIFEPTAGVGCTIFPKLCMVIRARRDHQKRSASFLIQCTVFPTGRTDKYGLIDWRAVSQ